MQERTEVQRLFVGRKQAAVRLVCELGLCRRGWCRSWVEGLGVGFEFGDEGVEVGLEELGAFAEGDVGDAGVLAEAVEVSGGDVEVLGGLFAVHEAVGGFVDRVGDVGDVGFDVEDALGEQGDLGEGVEELLEAECAGEHGGGFVGLSGGHG